MIYTSYFARMSKLPTNVVPVAIAARPPKWYRGWFYRRLAPSWDLVKKYKEDHDEDYYTQRYREDVLDKLLPSKVLHDLMYLSNDRDVALLCYEKPENFCHRHLVAQWLNDNGIRCSEYHA